MIQQHQLLQAGFLRVPSQQNVGSVWVCVHKTRVEEHVRIQLLQQPSQSPKVEALLPQLLGIVELRIHGQCRVS